MFKQTLRDVQNMYQEIEVFDKNYDEFKEICRVAWRAKFNYLCIDLSKKMKVYIVFSMRAKTHILNVIVKVIPFKKCVFKTF